MEATSHPHHEPAAPGGDNALELAVDTPRLPRGRETALRSGSSTRKDEYSRTSRSSTISSCT